MEVLAMLLLIKYIVVVEIMAMRAALLFDCHTSHVSSAGGGVKDGWCFLVPCRTWLLFYPVTQQHTATATFTVDAHNHQHNPKQQLQPPPPAATTSFGWCRAAGGGGGGA